MTLYERGVSNMKKGKWGGKGELGVGRAKSVRLNL